MRYYTYCLFTSRATEAINIALQGVSAKDGKPKHIITAATEHPAVLDTCKYLGRVSEHKSSV
ncbi:aminotransferase class V-fold PLP-dependent enzyme [Sphingobacterium daejeonense]|uniref:Aminotransferase class V-fold PLP-dependent enzyme n=1 Tax=Sphingobacterium daejeonense TaxID=371142 RepID=A0ABW3RL41_9SPHI